MSETTRQTWWGDYTIQLERAAHFEIGPMTLWIERHAYEWRVIHWSTVDPLVDRESVQTDLGIEAAPADAEVVRFATERSDRQFSLSPALADRSVVTRPDTPVFVMEGDSVGFFVGTPLWVKITVGEEKRLLLELPTLRPSDTWFGPSTMVGELAYAARTRARLVLDNVEPRSSRALTQVVVKNRGRDNFSVKRINLPIPALQLHLADDGFLWTDSVEIERSGEEGIARVRASNVPSLASNPKLISPAREVESRNLVVRALGALFG